MKGYGILSFGSVKGPKGLADEFYGFIKSEKRYCDCFLFLNDDAFTPDKRDAKVLNKVCERGTIYQ